jgi:myo-inositol-1-phosphate synthase
MHGRKTIQTYSICEDSLLACPIMLDIVLLCELITRVTVRCEDGYVDYTPHAELLGYYFKTSKESISTGRRRIIDWLKQLAGLL